MNPPKSNNHANESDELGRWIARAGDPGVSVRPEHAEQVRALLLDRLGPERPSIRRRPFHLGRWLAAGCIVIAAGLVFLSILNRPVDAWARVAQAMREKPWIHITAQSSNGPRSESWISPRFQIHAVKYDHGPDFRGADFDDLMMGVRSRYNEFENTIYLTPEGDDIRRILTQALTHVEQILHGQPLQPSSFLDAEIVSQKSRDVTEGGKTWKVHEIEFRTKGARPRPGRAWWRVDPATDLPCTCDVEIAGQKSRKTIDYPGFGPGDIQALGVPSTAWIVDRRPVNDLERILTGTKIGRNRFEDYCGYVWGAMGDRRVWRKGRKWRIEQEFPRIKTAMIDFQDKVPNDADLAWWKRREKDVVFAPTAICDGQTIWYLKYDPKQAMLPGGQPDSVRVQSVAERKVQGPADDPVMVAPQFLPEQIGHRNLLLPDVDHELVVDFKPGDGLPNTRRLRVVNSKTQAPQQPDHYVCVDPDKNYLAIKAVVPVLEPRQGGDHGKCAHVDIYTLADLARSPSGFWYPTRVVRKASGSENEQHTRFALDFEREIPDSLFERPK